MHVLCSYLLKTLERYAVPAMLVWKSRSEISCSEILKFHEIVEFGDVLGAENALGSCAPRNVKKM